MLYYETAPMPHLRAMAGVCLNDAKERPVPRFLVVFFVIIALGMSGATLAQPAEGARAIVERGMAAYLKGDAAAAMREWVKGTFMESNPQAMSQANSLRQIEDFYGRPQGYDLIKESTVTPRATTLYFTLNYERGIAFARLNAYRKADGAWITTSFFFHTEAAQVFPTSLLGL
jgi:hypothetical protein